MEDEVKKTPEIAIQDLEAAVKKINKKLHAVENTSSKANDMAEGSSSRFEKLFVLHDDAIANINR